MKKSGGYIAGPPHRVYRFRGVEIDTAAGFVRRDGQQFPLRAKTHRLLIHLIEHRDSPVTKDALIAAVWDGAAVADATLAGCIKELRQALGDDARDPIFVKTLAKRGYWFVAPLDGENPAEAPPIPSPSAAPSSTQTRSLRPVVIAAAGLALCAALAARTLWRPLPSAPAERKTPWGEVAWWPLDEAGGNPVREKLHGWTAILPPGTRHVPGVQGNALAFDGREGVVLGGASGDSLPSGRAPRTVTAWVRTEGPRADTATIFQYGHPQLSGNAFWLRLGQTGRAGFGHRRDWMGQRRIDDGAWHFLAGVYEGDPGRVARLYVDGVEDGHHVVEDKGLEERPETAWAIGRALWGGTPYRGEIDDVRVYAHALRPVLLDGLYRCRMDPARLDYAGRPHFFEPVFSREIRVDTEGTVTNTGTDFAGVMFVERSTECSIEQTRGSDLGQDLRIDAELRPRGRPEGPLTEAGPFFRSRRGAPGDGIMGGTSAGYWVQLQSSGQVSVRRLNPGAVVAFSRPVAGFDPEQYHPLSMEARGEELRVWLDGRPVEFEGGVYAVPIPPAWDRVEPRGQNHGVAGIGFSALQNRSAVGGQQARAIRVRPLK